jgi:hypothetical protein
MSTSSPYLSHHFKSLWIIAYGEISPNLATLLA